MHVGVGQLITASDFPGSTATLPVTNQVTQILNSINRKLTLTKFGYKLLVTQMLQHLTHMI